MKAITYVRYGSPDVLHFEDVEKPVPKEDHVLVRVAAASVNAGDWHLLRGEPFLVRLFFGLTKPKIRILGADVAGRVEAVGEKARKFTPGDAVFGDVSAHGFGAFAEYVCVSEKALALKPDNISFEQAAAVPAAGLTALQALRGKGRIRAGEKVLIQGASGGVGSLAVQLARSFGAEVTAVCGARNVDMARALGADNVIDYAQEDFTRHEARYDLIHAVNGYHPITHYRRALRPKGRYVMTGGAMAQMYQAMFLGPWLSMFGGKKMGNLLMTPNMEDLLFLRDLLEAGKIAPVIDKAFPLREVPDAIRYLEEEHARGKVVISIEGTDHP